MDEHTPHEYTIRVEQDERLMRTLVLLGNTLAEQAETINNMEQTMSALSDAVDQLVTRIDANDQADKARIADLEQQVTTANAATADVQAQVDRLNALEPAAAAANPNLPPI